MTTVSAAPSRRRSGGAHRKTSPKGSVRHIFLPAAVMLLGVCILLYPLVASQWNNWLHTRASAGYEAEVSQLIDNNASGIAAVFESARRYNAEHTNGPILDPWLARTSEDNAEYQAYLKQLSGLSSMSSISIPSIDSTLPIYHGTSPETLQKGIGHLYGSALPVGGDGSHSVLTGHTGLPNATLWDNLVDVSVGDAIFLSTFGETLKYEVHEIEIVLPHETDSLATVPGEDLLTLITCTPYGVNTHRLLLHAHRVEFEPSDFEGLKKKPFGMQRWMWIVLITALLLLAAIARWVMAESRKAKNDADH